MNGPVQMYRARPIVVHDIKIDLPDCIYKLKAIDDETNNRKEERSDEHIWGVKSKVDISEQTPQSTQEMIDLEERQKKILAQLSELKHQMQVLKTNLTKTSNTSPHKRKLVAENKPNIKLETELKNLPELIINANPLYPVYSLKILQKLWHDFCWLSVKTHIHSSVNALPEAAAKFSEELEDFKPIGDFRRVKIRLIWKNVDAYPHLVLSNSLIIGEVNILRFFSRLGPSSLNYELSPNVYDIDTIFDNCYALIKSKTKTERNSLIQSISKHLGKSEWLFGGKEIGITDIGAYSSIKLVASNELNVTMKKWFDRCETVCCC